MKDLTIYINESLFDNDLVTKDISIKLEEVEDRDSAITYIEQNYKTEPEKSWEPKGRAIRIVYNPRLSLRIDFINKYEFFYTIYGPNDEEIYDCNSTREANRYDWGKLLDIKKFAFEFKNKKAKKRGLSQARVDYLHRVADKIYELL